MKKGKVKKQRSTRGGEYLTGLLNREELKNRVEEILRENKGISKTIVLWKIQGLREFNEVNGYLAGDNQIQSVAQILDQGIVQKDLLARTGGTEFLGVISTFSPLLIVKRFEELTAIASSEINLVVDVAFGNVVEETTEGYQHAYDQAKEMLQLKKTQREAQAKVPMKVKC